MIEEWFHNFPLEQRHASRDAYRLGNSALLVSAREIPDDAEHVAKLREQTARLRKNEEEKQRARATLEDLYRSRYLSSRVKKGEEDVT